VADLFCGVGSLGLEALSRGAEFVCFVEKDPKVAAVLEKNIEKAGFVKESKVIRANAFTQPLGGAGFKHGQACPERSRGDGRVFSRAGSPCYFDLIFVDPPYAYTKEVGKDSALGGLLSSVSKQLASDGIVVVRTERRIELLKQYGLMEIIERRQWGTMAITILRKRQKGNMKHEIAL